MSRVIVALSGGKASAWCAGWALEQFPKESVVLYFNDTRWEHPDLYRFLDDLSAHFGVPITRDSDGRSVEELFYAHNAIANNRMPFCSRDLKALRLQRFYEDGDTLVFGIGIDEAHRAQRIIEVYADVARRKKKVPAVTFPLIRERVSREDIDRWLASTGIREPVLYSLGFAHNNCSGGCVRQGKAQWRRLWETMPEVYAERERVEREVSEWIGRRATYRKDESLREMRERWERQEEGLLPLAWDDEESSNECIGICGHMA